MSKAPGHGIEQAVDRLNSFLDGRCALPDVSFMEGIRFARDQVYALSPASDLAKPTGDERLREPAQAVVHARYDVLAGETDGKGMDHLLPSLERLEHALSNTQEPKCKTCGGRGHRSTWVNGLQREVDAPCPDCRKEPS